MTEDEFKQMQKDVKENGEALARMVAGHLLLANGCEGTAEHVQKIKRAVEIQNAVYKGFVKRLDKIEEQDKKINEKLEYLTRTIIEIQSKAEQWMKN